MSMFFGVPLSEPEQGSDASTHGWLPSWSAGLRLRLALQELGGVKGVPKSGGSGSRVSSWVSRAY